MQQLKHSTSLYAVFADQVTRRPDAVAITDGPLEISYRQLENAARAYRLRLAENGVRPGDLVGISLAKGWEVVAAILAVLSQGCGYVPLDPAYPADRLSFMVENSRVRVVIAHPDSSFLPQDTVLVTRAADDEIATEAPPERPHGTPAYVIYTSGSTGVPKGVTVEEASVLELFRSCSGGLFTFGPEDVWTLYFSYSFDFSVWEIWGALLFGGRLVVVPAHITARPATFLDFLARERVTVLNTVPSFFKYLPRAYERKPVPLALRYIVFGGEQLDRVSVRDWMRLRPGAETLVNMYGITETTVHTTFGALTAERVASDSGGTWIGEPLPHQRVVLLAPDGTEVPHGEPGEAYVSGLALARGYMGRPGLTAERFLEMTLDGDSTPRVWYRTGDLLRRLDDGTYEYLCRNDRQISLRGFRIELGEVEAVLREEVSVLDAVAVTEETAGGESLLIVYVTLADDRTPAEEHAVRLRAACQDQLPAHMVPNRVVVVSKMPLAPSGKLDRARLSTDMDLRMVQR
ncbi:amino acid adenylation domain-containing protein [Streptomyces sp. PTM05]|uniref:Amino acid adenylation domain-containing protein n=1 Tax=Streptantibioticus parmotrematis TaxID=2873249 RepID=A0ABS7QQT3_9ACTN|nr:amino acid adenylation domain-containing protein [Streptantibioticus parmotrematis]MBY8884730.1 amino acid adenylation domain-containing protein [Streptantibioticus parmotrematis]